MFNIEVNCRGEMNTNIASVRINPEPESLFDLSPCPKYGQRSLDANIIRLF